MSPVWKLDCPKIKELIKLKLAERINKKLELEKKMITGISKKGVFPKISGAISKISEKNTSPEIWALGFLGIIGIRVFIEFFVASPAISVREIVIEYTHNLLFFLLSILLIWIALSLILKENPAKLSTIFAWASWLIILPPIIDIIKTGGYVYWSFYSINDLGGLWGQFTTFFGQLPTGIVYFGTKIVYIAAILLTAGLAFAKSKKWFKSILGGFSTYLILFFLGTFPSLFSLAYYPLFGEKKIFEVSEVNVIELFATPFKMFGTEFTNIAYSLPHNLSQIYHLLLLGILILLFFLIDRKKLWVVIKNFRYPQVIYHTGLFLIGLGLGYKVYPENFYLNIFSFLSLLVLIYSIWLAWKASVILNDIYDFKIDEISNPERPLQKKIFSVSEYKSMGIVIFLLSILGGIVIGLKFAVFLLIYQFIAWVYSAEPFRLKRFPVVATLLSSISALVVLFMGFTLFSGDMHLHGLSWRIVLLLILALTLSLPIKDFKDIKGDGKFGVWTIPVLLGEEKGRLVVAIGVFISFVGSVFLLNELRAFWWALILGGISFLIIANKKTNPKSLLWWILGTESVYVFILAATIFS